jgi:hypothetical protein
VYLKLLQENTNKAVIADFFADSPDIATSAFAATMFFNGYAAAMGYFVFPSISRLDMAGTENEFFGLDFWPISVFAVYDTS